MAFTEIRSGATHWEMVRDDDWHRTYTIKHQVQSIKPTGYSGPYEVHKTPGLPLPGSFWDFDGDTDPWAFCWPGMKIEPKKKDPSTTKEWEITQIFSTRPRWRCSDSEEITDPILEPPRIRGAFLNQRIRALKDRNGVPNCNSAWELYKGPEAEYDDNKPVVEIQMNVAELNLPLLARTVNTLNDAQLWGLEPRCIKLSTISWERNMFAECSFYFTINYHFDINYDTFDRELLDYGTKALHGENFGGNWVVTPFAGGLASGGDMPDPKNPRHFVKYKDANSENIQTLLDGGGLPITDGEEPVFKRFEYYRESNFLLLNLPEDLES